MDIQKLLDNLTEEVSCKICGDIYKEPKQLPCLHSFCLTCLDELTRKRAINGNIQCPLCQRNVAVPDSGTFESLPSSFYINSLLDVLAIKQCGNSQVTCGNCANKSQQSSYCFHCSQFWCGECLNGHNILRANKEHRVLALKDFQAKDYEDVFKRPAICKKRHHEKVLQYHCTPCDVVACQTCVILEHGGHDITLLKVISEDETAKITAGVEKVKRRIGECTEEMKNIDILLLDIEENAEAVKRGVNSFAEEMIRVIREKQRQLISESEHKSTISKDRLTADKEKIQNRVKELQSVVDQADTLVQRGASVEIVRSRKQVKEQLQEPATQEQDSQPQECSTLVFEENLALTESLRTGAIGRLKISPTNALQSTAEGKGLSRAVTGLKAQFMVTTKSLKGDVCYSPGDRVAVELKRQGAEESVENIQVADNKNGTYQVSFFAADPGDHDVRVTVNRKDVGGTPFPPTQVQLREFHHVKSFGTEGTEAGQFDHPWGVAVNDHGEMAVSDCSNHRVQVFSSDGQFLCEFGGRGSEEGQLIRPSGMMYDKDGNLLVVDRGNNRIQQFSRTGEFIKTIGGEGELNGELSSPRGISSYSKGNCVVADRCNKRVVVFSPEGHVQRTVVDDKLDPLHCIQSPDGRLMVSDRNEDCIKVFSEEGDFLYQFGRRGTGNGEFDEPGGLATDESGRLVVCDSGNDRIQLFGLDGTFYCTFGVKEIGFAQLNSPVSVAVLKDGRFAVTEWNGHRVHIFR